MTSMPTDSVLQLDWESRVQINELEPLSPPTKVWGANKEGDEEYRIGIKNTPHPHPHSKENGLFIYCSSPHGHDLQYLIGLSYFKFSHKQTLRKECVKAYKRGAKKKKIAGGRASDKGQRSWQIIAVSHSHIPPWATGRLWEMVSNVHPGVISTQRQGTWDIYTAIAASRVASGKNCQAKPYKCQQLELWQRTPKRLESAPRRPPEVLFSRADTVLRSTQEQSMTL